MKGLTLSVAQLNEYVRRSLASDPMLKGICLRGEISNFKRHISGHWYFTLKDTDAAVNCAMFRQAAQGVHFQPQNGMQVRLFGSVGLYAKTGAYQFYGDAMEQDGLGELYLRFEALKARLSAQGLFDAASKKPLPLLPSGIGIVTSKTGAVLHDITRVAWRRFPGMPLYLYPVKVQGEGAAQEIAQAIRLMDKLKAVDVLIVGRGGGSMEDLWAFNDEEVARAIYACYTPVVSAVGHETDFTIADFVSDVRAPTPSAAAEICVPELESLYTTIASIQSRIARALEGEVSKKRLLLNQLTQRLEERGPMRLKERMLSRIMAAQASMEAAISAQLVRKQHALERFTLRIRAASPTQTMQRGYAIVTRNGQAIRSAHEVQAGDALYIQLTGGRISATVTHVEGEKC